MKGLLKVLSALEVIIGILSVIGAILYLVSSGIMNEAVNTATEQSLTIGFKAAGILLLISGLFNLACGICGLRGVKGNLKSISHAVKLGVIGLIAAAVSAFMMIYGQATAVHIAAAISSSVIPVLFLISAVSVKSKLK